MKRPITIFSLILLGCLTLCSNSINAQPLVTGIELTAPRQRSKVQLPVGKNLIHLTHLTEGFRYRVYFASADKNLTTRFDIQEHQYLNQAPLGLQWLGERRHAVEFTAPADNALVLADVLPPNNLTDVPVMVSVKCVSCPEEEDWQKELVQKAELANLSVSAPVSSLGLITNTLVGGNCYQVNGVTSSGANNSRGTFNNGATNIGIQNGMVMSTGNANNLSGPNNLTNYNGGFSTNSLNDPDLATIANGDQWDVSIIEFNFTPTASMVQFDFVFGSEEHCEFANSNYNDVFGFFISGPGIPGVQNLAVLPNSSTPVSINTINYNTNSNFYINNTNSGANCVNIPAVAITECQLDGWTTVLKATANVIPCNTYHIKLAIADVADDLYTSAVFLRANSFDAGGNVSTAVFYPAQQNSSPEGCPGGSIRFTRSNPDASQPLNVNFTVGGSAQPGIDYAPIGNSITIPAFQNFVDLPINAFADNLSEGPENIQLTIENACACTQSMLDFIIEDKPAIQISLSNQTICQGATATIGSIASGGISTLNYKWNTGSEGWFIQVNATNTTAYTVTVTDGCGDTASASALLIVSSPVLESDTIALCPGTTYPINGVSYPAPNVVTDTLPGQNGACDTIRTYTLQALPYSTGVGAVFLCPGESFTLNGIVYTQPAVVFDTIPGADGACDQIVRYTISLLDNPTLTQKITFCPGETILIGGNLYTQPGVVVDTLHNDFGCDTIATYILEALTPAPSNVQLNCPSNIVLTSDNPTTVQFPSPTAASDCPCPGISVVRTSGQASGTQFPVGETTQCYTATDSCGNSATCCFTITIAPTSPCDIKVIGCVKYELLTITQDPIKRTTYRIRVTNNCTNRLVYTAFQIPNGTTAFEPAHLSTYYAPSSGRAYAVRNPNFSPFYSIRFFSNEPGIFGGQSDIFKYTLPPASSLPAYILLTSKVGVQEFYESHLNTFFCPIGVTPIGLEEGGTEERISGETLEQHTVKAIPNPVTDALWVDLSDWEGAQLTLQIFDMQGRRVGEQQVSAAGMFQYDMPSNWNNGLYLLQVITADGQKYAARFVLQR
jgi:hypothetical protein